MTRMNAGKTFESERQMGMNTFNPVALLNELDRRLGARSDAELARMLGIHQSVICRLRKRKIHLTDTFLIRVMDSTNLTLKEIRQIAGVPK